MLTEESGGIPWNIPQIMGEIISSERKLAEDYIDILFSYIYDEENGPENFLEYTPLRKSVYSGILEVSKIFPDLLKNKNEIIDQRIKSEDDPEILAFLCMIILNSNLGQFHNFVDECKSRNDLIEIYRQDSMVTKTLSEIAVGI